MTMALCLGSGPVQSMQNIVDLTGVIDIAAANNEDIIDITAANNEDVIDITEANNEDVIDITEVQPDSDPEKADAEAEHIAAENAAVDVARFPRQM